MRSNLTFRLSAQNSLKITEVPIDKPQEKNLLNTFKGGNDLRNKLGQTKPKKTQTLLKNNKNTSTFQKQSKKSEQEVLFQQIASLDHFKPAVTREKTKNMIESIKLRRRQKHIDTLSRFKQDLDDYKQNLVSVYSSIVNDLEQLMLIKQTSISDYLESITDDYLLTRESDLITEIQQQTNTYKIQCSTKLTEIGEELEKVKERRGDSVKNICDALRQALIEIAFVLENQARDIQNQEREHIQKMQGKYYEEYKNKYQQIVKKQEERSERVSQKSQEVIKKWRQIKEKYQIDTYISDAQAQKFRRPEYLRQIYDNIIILQNKNHQNKIKLLENLIHEDADAISKQNMKRWNSQLKKINDSFDTELDQIINKLIQGKQAHKNTNCERSKYCKQRMNYIQNHNEQEVQEIFKQKILPLQQRNIQQQQKLISDITGYVQKHDDRQNQVFLKLSEFVQKIGSENDTFTKQFTTVNQKYEIQKAKILDDDQEAVEKLQEQLEQLKKELKEALHHIKLDEVEAKCFEKVDEIQAMYRACHKKNKELQQTRKPILQGFMKNYESKIAELLMLYSTQRRNELEQKNKKDAEEQATKRLEKEEKKKAEEEARLIEEAKAKGGKPPAPAKKDPKKAAAQQQQRKKAILAEIGTKKIQQFKTEGGSLWLVYKNITQICENLFHYQKKEDPENNAEQQEEQKQAVNQNANDEENPKAIDAPDQQLKDYKQMPVVSAASFVQVSQLVNHLSALRQKIFDKICEKRDRVFKQAEQADQQMLEQSLITLDNRLKAHYSLKGQIQSEIYVKRSGEITGHKKKYQKYARTVKDKMDLQTQKFNFLLENGLQTLKSHNTQQKKMKEHIQKCKNLSQLQGMYSRTKQNFNNFGLTMKQMYGELDRLSSSQIDTLLQKNEDFIKQSKLMGQGGDYSNDEIEWYDKMLSEITTQIKDQQIKRKQKYQQLKQHSEKKRAELLQSFEKQYNVAVEQMSARDGTGKKYGRPKRIAQQKTRLQMNKCQQAQISIDNMISDIGKQYEKNMKINFKNIDNPPTLEWRKKLMTVYTCIVRYAKHIQALKTDLKITEMMRVNYNEQLPECKLTPEEEQSDKKRKQEQLKFLGKLAEQKDDRVFMKYIQDIEKVISQESRTIYVGDKAKFLTGTDKIPDFLRTYIANMKRSAQDFRISCIRQLRQSCNKLSNLSNFISQLFFMSILNNSNQQIALNSNKFNQQFHTFIKNHKKQRASNMKQLRPNLNNPKCQDQLKQLDQRQKVRNTQYCEYIEKTQKQFKDNHFAKAELFLNRLLNNYQFLLNYTNSLYLFEDFVKVPGDQINNKTHLDVQKLMVMKQKGIKIDPTSERNLRRKWEGFDFTVFDIGDRKFTIKKVAEQAPKQKDKKAGKKDSKDPKKQQQPVEAVDANKTKVIQTFKTWRQKSVFQGQNKALQNFKACYHELLESAQKQLKVDEKQNKSFEIKWRETADSLYLK